MRFSEDHSDADAPLQAWRKAVESSRFSNYADLKTCFNSVDRVGHYYVFNRHVFTHRRYDRWKP